MSGMEISNLIQTGELAKDEVADKLVKEAEAHAEEQIETIKEQKSKRKKALIKFGSMAVLAAVVVVFATIAWFTMNKSVGTSGMGVKAGYNGFELRVASGNIGYSDLYSFPAIDSGYSTNTGLTTGPGAGEDTIRWRISGSDDKIKPGTCGCLEFEIIPYEGNDPSSLVYKIDISTFTAVTTKVTENEITYERVDSISEVTSTSGSALEQSAANRLRTHLMFFKSATPDADPTKDPTGYHGFISDISSFTLTPTDEDHDGVYNAVIYWIWPNTFGQIALPIASQKTGANAVLDTTGETSDRSAITTYMSGSNVNVFFKGSESYSTLLSDLYTKKTNGQNYDNEYKKLSAGYNSADREIGSNLDFILLTLTANIN